MPELKLVRTLDQIKDDVIRDLRTNWKSIRDLERRHGLSRNTIVDLQKLHDPHEKRKNIVKIPRAPQKAVISEVPKPESNRLRTANAVLIWLVAFMLGGVGMFFNVQYWYNFGGIAFGVLGAAIDGVTIFLPANLDYRRLRHYPLLGLWLICAALSTIAALGFSANHIGDSLQGRENVAQHRKALTGEQANLQAERATIAENRDPLVIEDAIQNERNRAVRYDLRAAKRMAERKIELDNKLHQLAEDIARLPSIAGKDPGAEGISRLSAGMVEPSQVEQFRVLGFAFMPSLAGFLLAFARTLMK